MSRQEFMGIVNDILMNPRPGIEGRALMLETIVLAADAYAQAEAAITGRRAQLAAIPVTEDDCA